MASAEPVHVLRGHFSDVQSLTFLSEGRLYSGDSNGELRLWDLTSCRTQYTARLHDANAGIMHLAYLPANGILVSQGRDGCVKLWAAGLHGALDRPQPLHEIRTESFNFCRCAVWPPCGAGMGVAAKEARAGQQGATATAADVHGVLVASASHDPADVGVWRPAESPTAFVTLRQGNGADPKHGMCMSLAFMAARAAPPQGQQPVEARSADVPGSACSYAECDRVGSSGAERSGGRESAAVDAGSAADSSGTGADPRFILTGYEDGVVALWDLRMPARPLGSLRVHGDPVMCLDVRESTKGRSQKEAKQRDSASGAGVTSPDTGGTSGCSLPQQPCGGNAGTPTGSKVSYDLISGSADDKVSCCVVRPSEAQPLELAHQLKLREPGTADVRIRADGKLFACGCWDGRVRLYSLRRREPLAVLKYHRGQVTAVAFSPQTNILASASRDTTITLWGVYSSAPQQ